MNGDPLWYKDAVIYELHVRAFCDSTGDGVGDFAGLTRKLDYLQDLGVTALWLLPFCPSPLRDDGYDISDYAGVNPAYGTLRDFIAFLREAHRRGLRVITELVLNHTSDQHPWFQKARRSRPGSPERDFYVWSDAPERYREARIIFKDFESSNWAWDPVAGGYYWHRFYSHQPDLNFDNPRVRRAVTRAVDFWLRLGVDGLRLDAVPYLYEREGTSCENLPETHAFLRELRAHVEGKFKSRMLLAEANQWPEDAVTYFGSGDECHMTFHFPLMPRLFMAIRLEDRFPIVDILEQTPPVPETCQWAAFLRNHDELTLEMVTDEERDYMYRVYAQDPQARINLGIRRRLAPLLQNNRRRIELMNGLLLSLIGTPVIYYGDEIGMGDNIYLGDRNGVRTPLQWNSDQNAGFSRANPQKLYLPVIIDPEYHYMAVNVEAQQRNPHSLLWWMKRLISLRKSFRAFGRGSLEFVPCENRKVLAFVRRHQEERILVVANLSRFVQCAELDLSPFQGATLVELFGRTEFPPATEKPYFLTLAPHTFYWFSLERKRSAVEVAPASGEAAPAGFLEVRESWEEALAEGSRGPLEGILLGFLRRRPWFEGRGRRVSSLRIGEELRLGSGASPAVLLILHVEYLEGDPENYLLPVAFVGPERASRVQDEFPQAVIAGLRAPAGEAMGVIFDGLFDPDFLWSLLQLVARRRRVKGPGGEVVSSHTPVLRQLFPPSESLQPTISRDADRDGTVAWGGRLQLRLYRKLEPGVSPDLEVTRFLGSRGFRHVPPAAGALEYRPDGDQPQTLGVLRGAVASQGDAWGYTLDALGRFLERAMVQPADAQGPACPDEPLVALSEREPPKGAFEMVGTYLQSVELLGRRAAELHRALASDPEDAAFAPEPYTPFARRSFYQSRRSLTGEVTKLLSARLRELPERARSAAQRVLDLQGELLERFRSALERPFEALRIRCHGDLHLGRVLFTGKDFVFSDFDGEPGRPLGERRLKRSALRDVAAMVRSFHYAVSTALSRAAVRAEDRGALEPWGRFWLLWVSVAFLRRYREGCAGSGLLPAAREDAQALLDVHLLERALHEVRHELLERPAWLEVPLQGILDLLSRPAAR